MAIAPDSASYPVLGACQATGVSYADGLAFVDAPGPLEPIGSYSPANGVKARIIRAHGMEAFHDFFDLIHVAHLVGRLRVKRWAR